MRKFLARHDARTGREAAGETSSDARADAAAAHRAPRAHIAAARSVGARCAADRRPGRWDTARRSGIGRAPAEQHPEHADHQRQNHDGAPREMGARAAARQPLATPAGLSRVRPSAPELTGDFPSGSPGSSCSARLSSERASDELALLARTAPPERNGPWRSAGDRAAPDPSSAAPDRGGRTWPPRRSDARSDRHPPPHSGPAETAKVKTVAARDAARKCSHNRPLDGRFDRCGGLDKGDFVKFNGARPPPRRRLARPARHMTPRRFWSSSMDSNSA